MSPITEDQAVALIASMRADGDRFRERARAAATLGASVAGALTAGLVFSAEGQSLPLPAKAAGILGVLILSLSVCFFLSASLYYVRERKRGPDKTAGSEPITVQGRLDAARTMSRDLTTAISCRTEWGKWTGVAGLVVLALMVPLGIWWPEERTRVGVQVTSISPPSLQPCPRIKEYVEGDVRTSQLSGTSTLIPVLVSNRLCTGKDEPGSKTVYFARSQVVITVLENQ